MQFVQLPALGEELESAFEGGDSQPGLSCKQTGASCLQMKARSARPSTGIRRLGDLFEEFSSASVFTLVEHKVRFLQNGRHFVRESLSYMTAEHAAHNYLSWMPVLLPQRFQWSFFLNTIDAYFFS